MKRGVESWLASQAAEKKAHNDELNERVNRMRVYLRENPHEKARLETALRPVFADFAGSSMLEDEARDEWQRFLERRMTDLAKQDINWDDARGYELKRPGEELVDALIARPEKPTHTPVHGR